MFDPEVFDGDVHLYPANYGTQVPVFESMLANFLEMDSLHNPSLVIENGLFAWLELIKSHFIFQANLNGKLQVVIWILEASNERISHEDISSVRSLFDIGNQFKMSRN